MGRKNRLGLQKVFGLSGIMFILFQTSAPTAQAWGLFKALSTDEVNSYLVKHVIRAQKIAYCLEIQDPDFSEGTIQRQVEAALSVWLKPLEELGVRDIAIRRVACSSSSFNLKVEIGPEMEHPTLGSYQTPESDGDHRYSVVKIDSGFQSRAGGRMYGFVDFESFVPRGTSLQSMMNWVSVVQPMSVQAFAQAMAVDYETAYWSTYRVLIHELGHSFGLCDTYASAVQRDCDPAYRTENQPASVMFDSNTFYLSQDDIGGIQALFTRFLPRS